MEIVIFLDDQFKNMNYFYFYFFIYVLFSKAQQKYFAVTYYYFKAFFFFLMLLENLAHCLQISVFEVPLKTFSYLQSIR